MKLDRTTTPDLVIIHVKDSRIDAVCALEFKEAMHEAMAGLDRRIMLDLAEVDFIDSSGLGAVVAVRKLLGGDRPLELARLRPSVEKVFRLTRMDSVFPIHPELPDLQRDAV